MVCDKLTEAINKCSAVFDVVGGVGLDTSGGEESCMGHYGLWFNFCPFCGRRIAKEFRDHRWRWFEVED
jgi:hypothetical protein